MVSGGVESGLFFSATPLKSRSFSAALLIFQRNVRSLIDICKVANRIRVVKLETCVKSAKLIRSIYHLKQDFHLPYNDEEDQAVPKRLHFSSTKL